MRILVLSFYYRPDLSAGSFRTTALVRSLVAQLPPGATIDVVTTLPNRYHSFSAEAPAMEHDGPLTVHRVALPAHRSGMRDQSRAFLAFAREVLRLTRGARHDLVFATSSRLMTAALGALTARRMGARLYLDIRDIFVDTINDIGPRGMRGLMMRVFGQVERWTIGRAARVNLVSRGFEPYFRARYRRQRFSFFTNGVDDEFLAAAPRQAVRPPARPADAPVTVLYAGNLGEGQGMHAILPALATRMGRRAKFRVIGDGGRRDALVDALAAAGADNVEISAPVSRAELIAAYRAADVLFLHLNDHDAFRKVLPSKLFEYAAMGKPIWAGVAGHAAEFMRDEVTNGAVFAPCDVEDALRSFAALTIADRPRTEFLVRYARSAISRAMAAEILAVAADA
jgi:glycosyltransferase involved in cell wall biosynthesis